MASGACVGGHVAGKALDTQTQSASPLAALSAHAPRHRATAPPLTNLPALPPTANPTVVPTPASQPPHPNPAPPRRTNQPTNYASELCLILASPVTAVSLSAAVEDGADLQAL